MQLESNASHANRWPLSTATAIYFLVFAAQLHTIVGYTGGKQLYPMDDVYIHAAVAKNLLLHGTYGVSPYHYSFPSSSIVWPFVLLLTFSVFGVKAWIPLALNVVFAMLYLALSDRFLKMAAPSISPAARFWCLLLLVLGVPFVGLSFEGMEHVLHALSILGILYCYYREQADLSLNSVGRSVGKSAGKWGALLAGSSAFATAVRYESFLFVFLVCLLLFWRRQWLLGFLTGACSLVPALAFGLFAWKHAAIYLPVSLLLKTSSAEQLSLFTGVEKLFSPYALLSGISFCFLVSAAGATWLTVRPSLAARPLRDLLLVLSGAFLLHAQLAQFGWLFRYEAYLLATTVVLVFAAGAVMEKESGSLRAVQLWRRPLEVAAFLLTVSMTGRAGSMLRAIPRNAAAIYEQQYQTARFLGAYYPGQAVGLNDIGAPSFFANIDCIDLFGLASNDVARLRRTGALTRRNVARISSGQGLRVAILYPELFPDQIPDSWIAVSSMVVTNLPGKVQLGERKVTLYAPNAHEAALLLENIQKFRSSLPSGVEVVAPAGVPVSPAVSLAAGIRPPQR